MTAKRLDPMTPKAYDAQLGESRAFLPYSILALTQPHFLIERSKTARLRE